MPAVNALASLTDERVGSESPPTVSNSEIETERAATGRSIESWHRRSSSGTLLKPLSPACVGCVLNLIRAARSLRAKQHFYFFLLSFTRRRRSLRWIGDGSPSLSLSLSLSLSFSLTHGDNTRGPPHGAQRRATASRAGVHGPSPRAEDPTSCPPPPHGLSISGTHARRAVLCCAVLCSAVLCSSSAPANVPLLGNASSLFEGPLSLSINGTARVCTHHSLDADPFEITMSRIRVRSTILDTLYRGESLVSRSR